MIRAGREVSPESVCTLGMSKMYVIEFLCVMKLFDITPYPYINSLLKFEIMATQLPLPAKEFFDGMTNKLSVRYAPTPVEN